MDVEFIATMAVIVADPPQGRKLFIDVLGLPLEGEGDGYYSSGDIPGEQAFRPLALVGGRGGLLRHPGVAG